MWPCMLWVMGAPPTRLDIGQLLIDLAGRVAAVHLCLPWIDVGEGKCIEDIRVKYRSVCNSFPREGNDKM